MRVEIKPELLRWARERAGLTADALAQRLPKLEAWERGEGQPTLKQVEQFAKATHTPVGYLFLAAPPVERLPIPDFRTIGGTHRERASPDLLETIYLCQQRQEWYRDFSRANRDQPFDFIGSASPTSDVVAAAASMRHALGFDLEERRRTPTWAEALRRFIEQADALGVLVMVSGVVGNNNRRRLDPDEFRGFALVDALAPLVFINGADTKAAQMFTLAHELAHVWLGESALSDTGPSVLPADDVERPGAAGLPAPASPQAVERWCNRVAAELLVPLQAFRNEYRRGDALRAETARLARGFKVSTLVVLRRIYDAGGLDREGFRQAYQDERERLRAMPRGSGGDFYLTQAARVGKRFARALVVSTMEGHTLYRDAFRLLGFAKHDTFRELGRSLGIPA